MLRERACGSSAIILDGRPRIRRGRAEGRNTRWRRTTLRRQHHWARCGGAPSSSWSRGSCSTWWFPGDPENVTWEVAIAAGPEVQPDVVVAVVPPAADAIIPDKDQRILEAVRRAVDHVVVLSTPDGALPEGSAGALFFLGDGKQVPRHWEDIPICYSDYELMTVCYRCAQELVTSSTADNSRKRDMDRGVGSSDHAPATDDVTDGVEEYYTLPVPSSGVSTPSSATTAVLSKVLEGSNT